MKIIHDGDAAYEDIMALSLLLLNANVVAVTVAYGESNTPIGAANMERVCQYLKPSANIPVAYGVNSALNEQGTPFPDWIHHEADNILDGTEVPVLPLSQIRDSAVELIYETLMSSSEKITIVATGPLTNIAQLIDIHPDSIEKIEKIIIMGGAVRVSGNISDLEDNPKNTVSEWNMYADPKAAEIVMTTSKLPIILVPLDITSQMRMTKEFYANLDREASPALKLVKAMLTSLLLKMGEEKFYGNLQFWDSLSAMITLDSSMATFEELPITIGNEGETNESTPAESGMMIQVAMKLLNPVAAYETFLASLRRGGELSTTPHLSYYGYPGILFQELVSGVAQPLHTDIPNSQLPAH